VSESPVVALENVTQRFRIIHERQDTLRGAFISLLRKRDQYEDLFALKNISFQLVAGETVGVIGRNGSGKSTLLRIIAHIYKPTSGRVEVQGKVSPLIELGAGFHPELTGRENVFLNGVLLGFTRKQMREKFDQIVAFSELEEFIDTPVKQYSSGMLMRLGFSVATEVDPEILLVDEVLAVGDEAFQRKCLERLDRLWKRGRTVVFVSHDMQAVGRLCQRVLLLNQGELVADSTPAEVIPRYHELMDQPAIPAKG
jgi:ABC-type polysaccharide/polyol phosphate transport system ATPase subunit